MESLLHGMLKAYILQLHAYTFISKDLALSSTLGIQRIFLHHYT